MLDIPLKLIIENVKLDIIFQNLKTSIFVYAYMNLSWGIKDFCQKLCMKFIKTIYGTFSWISILPQLNILFHINVRHYISQFSLSGFIVHSRKRGIHVLSDS